jgi:putative transposase
VLSFLGLVGGPGASRRGARLAEGSFFALLKAEIGTHSRPDRTTARAEIFTFVDTFYHRKRLRRHPVWGYLTPLETRQRHEQEHALAA